MIAKLEKVRPREQARASLDKELHELEPQVLYKKFQEENIPGEKMFEFVIAEYMRVYGQRNKRALQRAKERIFDHYAEKSKRKT